MRYAIKHEVPGRIRFDLRGKIPERDSVALEESFLALRCVTKCVAYPKAGSLAVTFESPDGGTLELARELVVERMETLTLDEVKSWEPTNSLALAPRPRHLFSNLANLVVRHFLRRLFLPSRVKMVLRLFRAIPFWRAGLASLSRGRLDVPVLDAAAITMGFMNGGNAAGNNMLLLRTGEILEDYTQRRSESSLVQSLLDIPTTARLLTADGVEHEVSIDELYDGDIVVARVGDAVPVDGMVLYGEAAVNQASLTGEHEAVIRNAGDTVYAGTAVEEGEIAIQVKGNPQDSKLRAIIAMVENAEAGKSSEQRYIEHLADNLVPWNFLLAGIVALTTRNLTKTSAALMVDYSCALRLSGSIAVMAAQRESARRGFTVKGSRYFDHMNEADTIVFDKTGTLTQSAPHVRRILAFEDYDRDEVLRLSACLEEHFPHPVARAVVNAAMEEGLEHRERHTDVEYIVAHGIVSTLEDARVVIGSEHFVLEDEGVPISPEELERIHEICDGDSPLFLAVDNILRGVLVIEDPLKPNVAEVLQQLREEGFKRIIMLTGDNQRTAERIARKADITEFHAEMLPEDKQTVIEELQAQGHRVAMVGDGVNDSPALSAAHVSIAMSAGSAVAREAADIALVSDDLESLVKLRRVSRILSKRMSMGYRFTVLFNTLLLALGIGGLLTPSASGILHNASTVALSAWNARAYLPGEADGRR